MKPIYLNDWAEKGQEQMISDFEISPDKLEGAEVLIATYNYECYEGDAFVLYRKGGKLFEINASHCSCYGLEGQWEPEETSVEALRKSLNTNYRFDKIKTVLFLVLELVELLDLRDNDTLTKNREDFEIWFTENCGDWLNNYPDALQYQIISGNVEFLYQPVANMWLAFKGSRESKK